MSRLALTQAGLKTDQILSQEEHQEHFMDGRSGVESTTSEVRNMTRPILLHYNCPARYLGRLWMTQRHVLLCGCLTMQPAPAWAATHSSGLDGENTTAGKNRFYFIS